jgi:voltage-gated potassium channel
VNDHDLRSLRARLRLPLALVGAIVVVATLGYWWLWRVRGGSMLDALYMTVITITTIGFQEVHPLDDVGRVFTMAVAIAGVASLFYTAGAAMEYLVSARLTDPGGRRRRMDRQIARLERHVIVAGLGRVGRQAADELAHARVPFVVVDPSAAGSRHAQEREYLHVAGDATEDAVLERAGIRRAKGVIVTTSNDATNMYIVLSARLTNPDLYIVSRAVDDASVTKLLRAGANRAISPYAIGGHRLAHLILSPTVVDFFETALRRGHEALNIESVAIDADCASAGRTLGSLDIRRATGATVLAVMREGTPIANPGPEFVLAQGDQVLALGTAEQLAQLERLLRAAIITSRT